MNYLKIIIFAVLSSTLLSCSYVVSEGLSRDGIVTGNVIFPDIGHATLSEGIFPNQEDISNVVPGISKKQVYRLLGRPHFDEMTGAKEWDYIFKFRIKNGDIKDSDKVNKIKTCQFKVIYDHNNIARQLYWKPSRCNKL